LGLPAGLPLNGFHLCILFTVLVSIYVSKPTQSLGFKISLNISYVSPHCQCLGLCIHR
jgi:hypothetical protein